ncbi:MAG: HAMP domain-containing histidine kinase [Lachnospiraceae bacterium]|nr:HAMP domain-containing histidine kinase [Lachnospiraceae bacterium]
MVKISVRRQNRSKCCDEDIVLRRLRRKLTTVCVATTGLILTVLTVICLLISHSEIRSQEYASFLSSLNTIYQNLQQQTSLSHTWIRQIEQNYQCSIRILDNGEELFFQTISEDDITASLMAQAQAEALAQGFDLSNTSYSGTLARHLEFTMKVRVLDSDQDTASVQTSASGHTSLTPSRTCYVSAAFVPRSGGVLSVLIVHSLSSMHGRIMRQSLLFLLADLAAWLLLSVFFWHFIARVLRPIRENREKQAQFIASASHELRSPLTVILSNTAAVKSGVLPCDSHFLNIIEAEGNRMSRLISDMLQLASADGQTWNLSPSEIEMDTLLLQIWEDFEPQAIARNLKWEISLPENISPRCVCDAERIHQLLGILIDNAFCYTPAGGRVCLALDCPESTAVSLSTKKNGESVTNTRSVESAGILFIRVIDNGPGIPDEEKEAVFERFHRLDRSRKDKSHFGLGLSIAREIVLLHHGSITVSDTPGGGTTFTLTLPLQ